MGLGIQGLWVVLELCKYFLTIRRRAEHKIAVIKRKVTVFLPYKIHFWGHFPGID